MMKILFYIVGIMDNYDRYRTPKSKGKAVTRMSKGRYSFFVYKESSGDNHERWTFYLMCVPLLAFCPFGNDQ